MLYNLFTHLNFPFFESNLQLLIFRTLLIFCSSLTIGLFSCKYFIIFINKKQICRQPIRIDGPESHLQTKKNTPTMGGLMIIFATLFSVILFADLTNHYILVTIFGFISFSIIGFIDDYMKVTGKGTKGFKGAFKLVIQFFLVGIILLYLYYTNNIYLESLVAIPFTNSSINLGEFYVLFAALLVVGTGNATNLTDGLDGLVSVPAIINLICLIFIIYAVSNLEISDKLNITNIEGSSELIIFCSALSGSILAFLKYNLKPAKIFMGDVGSLGIGASLGVMAIILKQELAFAIITLLFAIEALSVILQVGSYKLRKKRIFLMAPLHHHFEKLGWGEKKVVRSFWLASLIFSIIGLTSLVL